MGQSSAGRKGNKLFNKNHHLIFVTEMIFVQLAVGLCVRVSTHSLAARPLHANR